MASGKTTVSPEGVRKRTGTTPGGREYSAQSYKDKKLGAVTKSTVVRSKATVWDKQTSKHGDGMSKSVSKHRSTSGPYGGGKTYSDVKGPTKAKPSWKKTHTTPSGAKIRTGVTPGGRKYTAVRQTMTGPNEDATTYQSVKVGGMQKQSRTHKVLGYTVSKDSSKSSGSGGTYRRVEKGQTKPKRK